MKKLRVPDEVAATIQHLHPEIKKKIKSALKTLLQKPESGKKLYWELEGLLSYRIGNLRIIYRTGEQYLEIVALGPRRVIYEKTYQLLRSKK